MAVSYEDLVEQRDRLLAENTELHAELARVGRNSVQLEIAHRQLRDSQIEKAGLEAERDAARIALQRAQER